MKIKPATKDMLLFGAVGFACGSFVDPHCSSWEKAFVALGLAMLGALIGRFGLKH